MIEITHLDFRYKRTPVFNNINLRFDKGMIYGLLGENGVGKTTLLKIIMGLQEPQQGTCTVDGLNAFDRHPEMLQKVFLLPDAVELPDDQTPESHLKELTPFYPKANHEAFEALMEQLHVDPRRKFKEMSFGQQKKSLLAVALSLGTDYLLLDEPTNGLDIPSKADLRSVLSRRTNDETCIIISTHQVKDVENLIDPIVILSHDDVLLNASMADIEERLYFEYGGDQRTDALYSEMLPGGYMNVVVNNGMGESQINIEALFNTVLRNASQVKQLFANNLLEKGEQS